LYNISLSKPYCRAINSAPRPDRRYRLKDNSAATSGGKTLTRSVFKPAGGPLAGWQVETPDRRYRLKDNSAANERRQNANAERI
jgi:hypothetical protein